MKRFRVVVLIGTLVLSQGLPAAVVRSADGKLVNTVKTVNNKIVVRDNKGAVVTTTTKQGNKLVQRDSSGKAVQTLTPTKSNWPDGPIDWGKLEGGNTKSKSVGGIKANDK